MATGIMGITRPSDVSINDIEMYFNYAVDRYSPNNTIVTLNPSEVLSYCTLPSGDTNYVGGYENLLEGLYNLTLPASTFNRLGIYTIYIKPKMVTTTIVDCSVLSALPTVKGIVLNGSDPALAGLTSNNALQGYRIEYLSVDGNKIRNTVRYVVTSNKVRVVNENIGNTSQKANRYIFDDSGSLLFLQLTPSSSSDVKPNATPFIGNPNQTILISNTYFSPLVVEVTLVENTIDTISDIIAGEQVKDVQSGILTYYDANRVITKQFNLFEIKDDVLDVPLYEVKEKRTTIDESQDFAAVIAP